MQRLFQFLFKLVCDEFYGSVTIRFKKGKMDWPLVVNTAYNEEALPQPDANDPIYQALVAATVKGVL